ncbi:MAG: hypothetical protein J6S69_05300 [Proteobacteria bacterium]|nr:hypothetical protein [Pseudomonadota bacterium]
MLKKIWSEIPKMFRVQAIVAFCLLFGLSMGAGILKNAEFGGQTALMGGFSVALLCVYVVWVGRLMGRIKTQIEKAETDKDKEELATGAANKIHIASFIKLLALSGFVVFCVLVFKADILAAILGLSVNYLALLIVSLFVKSEPADAVENDSQSAKSEVE